MSTGVASTLAATVSVRTRMHTALVTPQRTFGGARLSTSAIRDAVTEGGGRRHGQRSGNVRATLLRVGRSHFGRSERAGRARFKREFCASTCCGSGLSASADGDLLRALLAMHGLIVGLFFCGKREVETSRVPVMHAWERLGMWAAGRGLGIAGRCILQAERAVFSPRN